MTKQHSNPMNARCGLEGCDCGYVIEKLVGLVEQAMLDHERDRLPSECWYSHADKVLRDEKLAGTE